MGNCAGPSRSDEAADYLSRYELYDEGFKLYKDDHERLPVCKLTNVEGHG